MHHLFEWWRNITTEKYFMSQFFYFASGLENWKWIYELLHQFTLNGSCHNTQYTFYGHFIKCQKFKDDFIRRCILRFIAGKILFSIFIFYDACEFVWAKMRTFPRCIFSQCEFSANYRKRSRSERWMDWNILKGIIWLFLTLRRMKRYRKQWRTFLFEILSIFNKFSQRFHLSTFVSHIETFKNIDLFSLFRLNFFIIFHLKFH